MLSYFLEVSSLDGKDSIRSESSKLHNNVPKAFKLDKSLASVESLIGAIKDQNVLSVTLVRHPFLRLISAYEDKVLGMWDGHPKSKFDQETFAEFIDNQVLPMWDTVMAKNCEDKAPGSLNFHWRPFFTRCGFCQVPYDVIGRLEHLALDLKYVMHKRPEFARDLPENMTNIRLHSTSKENSLFVEDNFADENKLNSHMKTLSGTQIGSLVKLFQPDFEMFGYNPYHTKVDWDLSWLSKS